MVFGSSWAPESTLQLLESASARGMCSISSSSRCRGHKIARSRVLGVIVSYASDLTYEKLTFLHFLRLISTTSATNGAFFIGHAY